VTSAERADPFTSKPMARSRSGAGHLEVACGSRAASGSRPGEPICLLSHCGRDCVCRPLPHLTALEHPRQRHPAEEMERFPTGGGSQQRKASIIVDTDLVPRVDDIPATDTETHMPPVTSRSEKLADAVVEDQSAGWGLARILAGGVEAGGFRGIIAPEDLDLVCASDEPGRNSMWSRRVSMKEGPAAPAERPSSSSRTTST
jgi:hypothetical protein